MRFSLSLFCCCCSSGVQGVLSSVVWEREWTLLLLWSFDDAKLSLEKKKSSFVEEFWQEKENGGQKREKKRFLLQEEGNLSLSFEGALWPIKSCFPLFFSLFSLFFLLLRHTKHPLFLRPSARASSSSREKESTHTTTTKYDDANKRSKEVWKKLFCRVEESVCLNRRPVSKERERERENQQGF